MTRDPRAQRTSTVQLSDECRMEQRNHR